MTPSDPLGLGFTLKDMVGNHNGEKGPKVMKVEPGSYAESKGLLIGDQILAVNGESIGNQQEFKDILSQINKGEPLFLLIFRNEKKIHLGLVREN